MTNDLEESRSMPEKIREFLGDHADYQGPCVVSWKIMNNRYNEEIEATVPKLYPDAEKCESRLENGFAFKMKSVIDATMLYGNIARVVQNNIFAGEFNLQVHGEDGTPLIIPEITYRYAGH